MGIVSGLERQRCGGVNQAGGPQIGPEPGAPERTWPRCLTRATHNSVGPMYGSFKVPTKKKHLVESSTNRVPDSTNKWRSLCIAQGGLDGAKNKFLARLVRSPKKRGASCMEVA